MKPPPTIRPRWSVPLANSIVGGGDCMSPAVVPTNPDHLYIGDGWGSTFASMKLRRLSLTTGETLATAPVKNSVRAIHRRPGSQFIYAASDKKIFVLDAETLAIVDKHDKKLLNYPAHLSSTNENTLLTADHFHGWLFTYELATRTGKRRRLAKSCRLLLATKQGEDGHYFADGQSGTLLHYDSTAGKQRTLWGNHPLWQLPNQRRPDTVRRPACGIHPRSKLSQNRPLSAHAPRPDPSADRRRAVARHRCKIPLHAPRTLAR